MNMKDHILMALREQLNQWEELLAGFSEKQLTTPLRGKWSIKDVVAHLCAWQERTFARLEGGRLNREPAFPRWPAEFDPDLEENTGPINAWIYETHTKEPWSKIHKNWRDGFQRCLEAAAAIPESDLLNDEKYAWLKGYPLAYILLATYEHHREHLGKLQTRLGSVSGFSLTLPHV